MPSLACSSVLLPGIGMVALVTVRVRVLSSGRRQPWELKRLEVGVRCRVRKELVEFPVLEVEVN